MENPFSEEKLKLGWAGCKVDPHARTLKLSTVFRALPEIPSTFNVDNSLNANIPTPMFGNDAHGCCVIAARGHQTLRFEVFEQRRILTELSTDNVLREWYRENGNTENGLYLLDSLKCWRNDGWYIGGAGSNIKTLPCWRKKPVPPSPASKLYKIHAFGTVEPKNHDDVKAVVALLRGAYIGLALPKSAQNQTIWDVVGDPNVGDSKPWSWGGHCVYVLAYDAIGPICITWGGKKRMTWKFFDQYCFECYGVIDSRNLWQDNSPVDEEALEAYLTEIQN